MNRYLLVTFLLTLALGAWVWQPWADRPRRFFVNESMAAPVGVYASGDAGFSVEVVLKGLELPWDIAFPSASEILVTEKAGRLSRVNIQTGQRTSIADMPAVAVHGQGGLHAVVLHPLFASNGLLYLSYAAKADGGYTTHFMRARLEGDRLVEQKLLLSAKAGTRAGQHFGGAMLFDRQGDLLLSVGDRGDREQAQNLRVHNGKVLRLKDDGSVPSDNPFVKTPGALPEIYSYGHRNPQGMSLDAATGRIWAAEHGPRGGDEINLILAGRNYGWPVITYGKEYVGGSIGEGSKKEGMEQPVHYYVPSIATAGIAYHAGDLFPQWKDSVLVAALRGHLNRVQLQDGKFVKEERLLHDLGLRIRAVRVSPSGEVWVVADDGVVLRIFKAPAA